MSSIPSSPAPQAPLSIPIYQQSPPRSDEQVNSPMYGQAPLPNVQVPIHNLEAVSSENNHHIEQLPNDENKIYKFALSVFKNSVITLGVSTAIASIAGGPILLSFMCFGFRGHQNDYENVFLSTLLGSILTGLALGKNQKAVGLTLAIQTILGAYVLLGSVRDTVDKVIICSLLSMISLSVYGLTVLSKNKNGRSIFQGHLLAIASFFVALPTVSQMKRKELGYVKMALAISFIANAVARYAKKHNYKTVAKIASIVALISTNITIIRASERALDRSLGFGVYNRHNRLYDARELAIIGLACGSGAYAVKREGKISQLAKDIFSSLLGQGSFFLAWDLLRRMTPPSSFILLLPVSLITANGVLAARIVNEEG